MDDEIRNAERAIDDHSWTPRPALAFAVRAGVVLVPIGLGTLTARIVAAPFPASAPVWVTAAAALLAALVVSLSFGHLAMRAMPLVALLKMTMMSRFKVARRASTTAELARRLHDADLDSREAATTLLALAMALGRHDRITRGHSERVRLFCDLLGAELRLSEADRGRLRWVGLLHDIGKLEVVASILNKPGPLDDRERRVLHGHPDNGARLAAPLADWLGPWFDGIAQHHERYDGTGYPLGLAGDQISLAGRAVAVIDAFDTMTCARSYKSPIPTAVARAELTPVRRQPIRPSRGAGLPRHRAAQAVVGNGTVDVPRERAVPALDRRRVHAHGGCRVGRSRRRLGRGAGRSSRRGGDQCAHQHRRARGGA